MVLTSAVYSRLQEGICSSAVLYFRYPSPILKTSLSTSLPWLMFAHLEQDIQQSPNKSLWLWPSWSDTFWSCSTTSTTFQMTENEVAHKVKVVPAFFSQWTLSALISSSDLLCLLFSLLSDTPKGFDSSLMAGYMCASVYVLMWFLASESLIITLQMSNNFTTEVKNAD